MHASDSTSAFRKQCECHDDPPEKPLGFDGNRDDGLITTTVGTKCTTYPTVDPVDRCKRLECEKQWKLYTIDEAFNNKMNNCNSYDNNTMTKILDEKER